VEKARSLVEEFISTTVRHVMAGPPGALLYIQSFPVVMEDRIGVVV
jgi:hypothetical protein